MDTILAFNNLLDKDKFLVTRFSNSNVTLLILIEIYHEWIKEVKKKIKGFIGLPKLYL